MQVHLIVLVLLFICFSQHFTWKITLMENWAEKYIWQETVDFQRAVILTKKTKQKWRKI